MMRRSETPAAAVVLSVLIVLAVSGCTRTPDREPAKTPPAPADARTAARGQEIFRDRHFGREEIACADCHADYPDRVQSPDRILPGHSILGADRRVSAWNGSVTGAALQRTAAGAARCAVRFQKRGRSEDDALAPDDARALLAFYGTISTGGEPNRLAWTALPFGVPQQVFEDSLQVELDAIDALRGSPDRGAVLFHSACARCHGGDLDLGPSPHALRREAGRLAYRVRLGYKTMPFFSRDKLSRQDIADIRDAVAAGVQ